MIEKKEDSSDNNYQARYQCRQNPFDPANITRALGRYLKPEPKAKLNGKAQLSTEHLTFSFNGTPVLNNVDLELKQGKMLGIIGPNGAGKSTLVRLLSRMFQPTLGNVRLNGYDLSLWRRSDLARVIAIVPQDPELPPTFTAWEMVLLGRTPFLGTLGRVREIDHQISRKAMEETRTWHLANRLICQLSGGEQQRVVIARALAQQPRVFLLDEPTAHLDINHQVETLSFISRMVRERDLAALSIFHDLNLAAQYCDELVLLKEGQIVAKGTPGNVLTPHLIQKAYGANVGVLPHPTNGLPVVYPTCPPA
ncbi:MAG: heme ABC transporter ATP-binding protein [Anaerolineales bacterium]|nr:heme ABC transporter ATP-binding protein [Anaerolineales bacterium]